MVSLHPSSAGIHPLKVAAGGDKKFARNYFHSAQAEKLLRKSVQAVRGENESFELTDGQEQIEAALLPVCVERSVSHS